MASSMAAGSSVRHLGQRGLDDGDQQVVGTRVAEHAATGLADRRAGGCDDVGVGKLLAHVECRPISCGPACRSCSMPMMRSCVFGMLQERAEVLALERHQVFLGHQRAGVDFAAAADVGDQPADEEVVLADEAAVTHRDQRGLDRGDARTAGHRDQALDRRAIPRLVHRLGVRRGHVQQFVLVRDDDVGVEQVADLARLERAGADRGRSPRRRRRPSGRPAGRCPAPWPRLRRRGAPRRSGRHRPGSGRRPLPPGPCSFPSRRRAPTSRWPVRSRRRVRCRGSPRRPAPVE